MWHSSLFENVLQFFVIRQDAGLVEVVDEFLSEIVYVLDCNLAPEVRVCRVQWNSETLGQSDCLAGSGSDGERVLREFMYPFSRDIQRLCFVAGCWVAQLLFQ